MERHGILSGRRRHLLASINPAAEQKLTEELLLKTPAEIIRRRKNKREGKTRHRSGQICNLAPPEGGTPDWGAHWYQNSRRMIKYDEMKAVNRLTKSGLTLTTQNGPVRLVIVLSRCVLRSSRGLLPCWETVFWILKR